MFRFPFTRCVVAFFLGWLGGYLAITHSERYTYFLVLGCAASAALLLSHKVFAYARVLLMFCFLAGWGVKMFQWHRAIDISDEVVTEVISWGRNSERVGRVRLWGRTKDQNSIQNLGQYVGIAKSKPDSRFFASRATLMAICDDPMPGGFSQSQYLWSQGLRGTVFLKKAVTLSQEAVPKPRNFAIAQIYKRYLPNHWGLALALTTGDKSELSPELKQQCKVLGISHVMAISGLHVGLVVLGVYWILFPLVRWPLVRVVITLAIGLFFVSFVGAPASAQRALWALSFFWLAKVYYRKFYLEIALSASLLYLALFAPHLIFSMGLHLSVGAVLGIRGMLLVTTHWNRKIRNPILKKIVLSTWVTLGAQLGTLPLILFHFNAFPTYFWWNNLWAIPLFTLLLYGLIIGCGLSFLGWMEGEWFFVLSKYMKGLEGLISLHSQWPHAQLEHLFPSITFCALLAVVIFALLYLRRFPWVRYLAVFILIVIPWTYYPRDHPAEAFCYRGRPASWTVENLILQMTAQTEDSAHFHQRLSDISRGKIYVKMELSLVNE